MEEKQIRTFLVDDEEQALEHLENQLREYKEFRIVGRASGEKEALAFLAKEKVDLIFSDIQMKDASGFSLCEEVHRRYPEIRMIFLTGYASFAVDGYQYRPLDFLVKPVRRERLALALQHAKEALCRDRPAGDEVTIGLKTEDGFHLFRPDEIRYLEKVKRRIRLVCRNNTEFWISGTLQEIEDALEGHGFYRCHQSYLVALREIQSIQPEQFGRGYRLVLRKEQEVLPLSRRNYHELLSELKEQQERGTAWNQSGF